MGITFGKDDSYMSGSTPTKSQISGLFDPRSPSIGISRTPIQFPNTTSVVSDPRSPTVELTSTPIHIPNTTSVIDDPRSPSLELVRTPIQIPNSASVIDPRSPSVELTRTPIQIVIGLGNDRGTQNEDEPLKIERNMKESVNMQEHKEAVTPVHQQPSKPPTKEVSKDPIKQKLQFDSPLSPARSPLATRNCNPEQPMDIVRRKQLQKVVERMNLNQDKENIVLK